MPEPNTLLRKMRLSAAVVERRALLTESDVVRIVNQAIHETIRSLRAHRKKGLKRGYRGYQLRAWELHAEDQLLAIIKREPAKRGRPRKDAKAQLAINLKQQGTSWARITKLMNQQLDARERLTKEGFRSLVRSRTSQKRGR